MNSADIAVIVPVYNRRTSVLEALDSIAGQTLPPGHLIVVDDGSSDGSAGSIRRWVSSRELPFAAHLICQPNRGVSAARNQGISAAADCRFFAFLDSDDIWPEDFLARMQQAFAGSSIAVAASCDRRFVNAHQDVTRIQSLRAIADDATQWLFKQDAGIASATVFRAAPIRQLGGFREDLKTAEDAELFFRLSLRGPWLYVPGQAVTYRHELPQSRGEAGNLSFHFEDKFRRTVKVYEEFIEQQGGKSALPRSFYAPILSKWWYRAGRELFRAGRPQEARVCFQRSTRWCRWNKAWIRLALTYLPRAA